MLAEGGLAGARRTVQAQPALAGAAQPGAQCLQVEVHVEQVQAVLGDAAAPGGLDRPPAHALQGAVHHPRQRILEVQCGLAVPDLAHHLDRALHQRRGQRLVAGSPIAPGVVDRQLAEAGIQHAPPGAARRHIHLQREVEAAPVGHIERGDAVGDPEGRHRVGLQHPVDPALQPAAVALHHRKLAPLAEDVLDLVEQDCLAAALGQQRLRQPEGVEARLALLGLAVDVGHRHLEEADAGGLSHGARQFGLAGAGGAVDQHVDARPALGHRLRQIVLQQREIGGDVGVVGQGQRRRRCADEVLREQIEQAVVADRHLVGQRLVDVDLVAERVRLAAIDGQQPHLRQPAARVERAAHLRDRRIDDLRHGPAQPVQRQAAEQFGGVGQLGDAALQHHELQHPLLGAVQSKLAAQHRDVGAQRRVHRKAATARLLGLAVQGLHPRMGSRLVVVVDIGFGEADQPGNAIVGEAAGAEEARLAAGLRDGAQDVEPDDRQVDGIDVVLGVTAPGSKHGISGIEWEAAIVDSGCDRLCRRGRACCCADLRDRRSIHCDQQSYL